MKRVIWIKPVGGFCPICFGIFPCSVCNEG